MVEIVLGVPAEQGGCPLGWERSVAYKAYTPYTPYMPYKTLAGIFFDTREQNSEISLTPLMTLKP